MNLTPFNSNLNQIVKNEDRFFIARPKIEKTGVRGYLQEKLELILGRFSQLHHEEFSRHAPITKIASDREPAPYAEKWAKSEIRWRTLGKIGLATLVVLGGAFALHQYLSSGIVSEPHKISPFTPNKIQPDPTPKPSSSGFGLTEYLLAGAVLGLLGLAANPSIFGRTVTLLTGAASSLIPKTAFDPFTGDSFAHLADAGVKQISFKITKTAEIKLPIDTLAAREELKFVKEHLLPSYLRLHGSTEANQITFNGERIVLQQQETDESIQQRIQGQEPLKRGYNYKKPSAVFCPENYVLVLGKTEHGEIPFVMPQHLYDQISKAPGQVEYGKKLKINMSVDPAVAQVKRSAITRYAELQSFARDTPELYAQLDRLNNEKIKRLPVPPSLQSKTADSSAPSSSRSMTAEPATLTTTTTSATAQVSGKKAGGLFSAFGSFFTRQPNPLIDDPLPQLVNELRQQEKHSATITIEKSSKVYFYGHTRGGGPDHTYEAFFPRCMRTNVPVKESLLDPEGNKVTFRKDWSVGALNKEYKTIKFRSEFGIGSFIFGPDDCILISGTIEGKKFVLPLPKRYYDQIKQGQSAKFSYDGFTIEFRKEIEPVCVDQGQIASFTVPVLSLASFDQPEQRMCNNISSFPKKNFIQYDEDQKVFEMWLSTGNKPKEIGESGKYYWNEWTEETNYWNTESEYSRSSVAPSSASIGAVSTSRPTTRYARLPLPMTTAVQPGSTPSTSSTSSTPTIKSASPSIEKRSEPSRLGKVAQECFQELIADPFKRKVVEPIKKAYFESPTYRKDPYTTNPFADLVKQGVREVKVTINRIVKLDGEAKKFPGDETHPALPELTGVHEFLRPRYLRRNAPEEARLTLNGLPVIYQIFYSNAVGDLFTYISALTEQQNDEFTRIADEYTFDPDPTILIEGEIKGKGTGSIQFLLPEHVYNNMEKGETTQFMYGKNLRIEVYKPVQDLKSEKLEKVNIWHVPFTDNHPKNQYKTVTGVDFDRYFSINKELEAVFEEDQKAYLASNRLGAEDVEAVEASTASISTTTLPLTIESGEPSETQGNLKLLEPPQ